MENTLKFTTSQSENSTSHANSRMAVYALDGNIDESSDYSTFSPMNLTHITFNLEGIKLINSIGVQRWIQFLEGIPAGITIAFEKCPLRIINQMNLFPEFTGGKPVEVKSFYAPYFCTACDSSFSSLIDQAQHAATLVQLKAPPMDCPKCKGSAVFDGIEKKYFVFLKRASQGKS